MKTFITEDFLLESDFARKIYHTYAKNLPILDYHCHLSPQQIAEDHSFHTITEAWLAGDHYKWRAMRTLGVAEKFVTGDADEREKFEKWAFTVPYTMRNPLYHWTHIELKRYFDIDELLSPATGQAIFDQSNDLLAMKAWSTKNLLRRMRVEVICTTDDPADPLTFHRAHRGDPLMFPTFRPDKVYAINDPEEYIRYMEKLGASEGFTITQFADLIHVLNKRIAFFHTHGCYASDHGLEHLPYFPPRERLDMDKLFSRIMRKERLNPVDANQYQFGILIELCKMYHRVGWVQQFHLGALRNANQRMLRRLGRDTGFDSIGDFQQAQALAAFLNDLDETNQLCKTILYNLNPSNNEVFATMCGNFNDGSTKGKIQFGSAWWFLDQKDGMEKQLNALSNLGLLSCFVGMITDSRSFLSFPRHEYFRRILCNLFGRDVERGELPADEAWIGQTVSDICYHNALSYFQFSAVHKAGAAH